MACCCKVVKCVEMLLFLNSVARVDLCYGQTLSDYVRVKKQTRKGDKTTFLILLAVLIYIVERPVFASVLLPVGKFFTLV